MPGFLLHTGMVMQCTHAATVVVPPGAPRVLVSGLPVATATSQIAVLPGCPFTLPGPKPAPCVTVKWLLPSARVKALGVPVLLQPGPGPGAGLCQSPDQIPNGPPNAASMQMRVLAT